ncbi:hypothetical protein QTP88_021198 [Uroleucon formosanum]
MMHNSKQHERGVLKTKREYTIKIAQINMARTATANEDLLEFWFFFKTNRSVVLALLCDKERRRKGPRKLTTGCACRSCECVRPSALVRGRGNIHHRQVFPDGWSSATRVFGRPCVLMGKTKFLITHQFDVELQRVRYPRIRNNTLRASSHRARSPNAEYISNPAASRWGLTADFPVSGPA